MTIRTSRAEIPTLARLSPGRTTRHASVAALVVLALGVAGAVLGHAVVPQVGILSWSIALGVAAANLRMLPQGGTRSLGVVTKSLLRFGIVLLGLSISFSSIAALGAPLIAVVAVGLVGTLTLTTWLGNWMGLSAPRSLLIGTGFAICGASAIAAMEDAARADEDDVAAAIAMVTLFGTVALVALPLLQGPLGLTDLQLGSWAGASVHEVGQVVAAASPAGPAVVATAVVVKLTRVVMLAPVVAAVNALQRRRSPARTGARGKTPLVPLFVLGFLACVGIRSTGAVPASALDWVSQVQVVALGAAMFGMGCSVNLASLFLKSGAVIAVSTVSTFFIAAVSLVGILLLAPVGT